MQMVWPRLADRAMSASEETRGPLQKDFLQLFSVRYFAFLTFGVVAAARRALNFSTRPATSMSFSLPV